MIDRNAALQIAAAIQTQEGFYQGSLSFRNNNPGNLRYAGQAGAVPGEGGFAKFPSYDAGFAAMVEQIERNATRGHDAAGRPVSTLADLIASWAPPNENDTAAYLASVTRQTGFAADAPLAALGGGADVLGGDVGGGAGETAAGAVAGLSAAVGVIGASVLWLVVR